MKLNHKLLIPGWAGYLAPDELEFVKAKLKADRYLRAKWGMGRGKGRLSEEKIRLVALDGVEALQKASFEDLEGDFHDEQIERKDMADCLAV